MDTEKKPKRPRIGATPPSGENEPQHYEKVNYPNDGQRQSTPRPYSQRPAYGQRPTYGYGRQSGYTNRQDYNRQPGNYGGYGPYNNYQRQQPYPQQDTEAKTNNEEATATTEPQTPTESYTPQHPAQQQSDYRQRPYNPNYNRQGGYHRQGGYNNNRQGGYNNNRQGGYNNNRQGGYNQGGYSNYNRQGGYNNRQGGYNNQEGYNQGGYNRQGGYNNQGGYNRQGGYNNQGGYNRQGGYGPQQGGYGPQRGRNFGPHPQAKNKRFTPRPKQIEYTIEDPDPDTEIRLNKYMSNAGLCSRREADEKILAGEVTVNGVVVNELGSKIKPGDVVEYEGKVVVPERKCYVLLNKPKDCVTTSDDPNGRTTVMDIVKNACRERIYPVGRLDRNTTGVLLLTNDGDLASKLTHPKFVKKKIYHVWTDKPIAEEDMQRIADGIELEDGEIHADEISYIPEADKNQAGIEIHSGRNRIVRRIFESLGYRVVKLDRVLFAGLTKKNLPRGKWRYLTQEEVNFLRRGSFE